MAKNLTELTARTATADTDLMHINSGGTDYKETKANFLKGDFWHVFANDTPLITQVDNLPVGTWFGYILSSGHQTETGVPYNASFVVKAAKYSSSYAVVTIEGLSASPNNTSYIIGKGSNGWGSWAKSTPTKTDITYTPNSDITVNRFSAYRIGDIVTVSFNMDTGTSFATNANLVQLSIGAPALIDFPVMNVTDGTAFQMYMTAGGTIRNGAALASGKRLIGCFSYAADA